MKKEIIKDERVSVPTPREQPITLDDYFLHHSPIPIRHTLLWANIKNDVCCCCCCCCCCGTEKEKEKEKDPASTSRPTPTGAGASLTIRWKIPITHALPSVLAPHGAPSSTKEILATMAWETTGESRQTRVRIQARIRAIYVNYETPWKDIITNADPDGSQIVAVIRYDEPIRIRTDYNVEYQAIATDPALPDAESQVQSKPVILDLQPQPQIL